MLMCVMAVVAVAPCQCFSPGGAYNDIAGANLAFRAVFAFHPAAAGGDNQPLPERMGVPGRARARLERDERRRNVRSLGFRKERIDPDAPGEPIGGAFH